MIRPTIIDIAREADVSNAAVSLVLNDLSTNRVGAAKKKKILAVAESLGYSPHAVAKALIQRKTKIVGLLVPMRDPIFFNQFIAQVLVGIQSCLIERGYHLMIFSQTAQHGKITQNQIVASRYVDGLIFINTRLCSEIDMQESVYTMNQAQIPFTMVNSYYGNEAINYVGVNDAEIGHVAGKFLASKGHSRIAFMGGSKNSPVNSQLLLGLRAALREKQLRLEQDMVFYSEYDKECIEMGMHNWLEQKNPPTAIFCADDQVVPEIYEVLHSLKVRIPQDIAVLGRGDLSSNAYMRPRLSMIAISIFEMGRRAAEILINSLEGKGGAAIRVLLPSTLIEREST